ncbi:MAG: hypothetical protein R3190_03345 [Thermoanaerobaculia bacterium]|nr:hypothetical protein [Thermoanaerobaculia bacterium]
MTKVVIEGEGESGRWARRYESCRSKDELLGALAEAVSVHAGGLAGSLQPRWQRAWTWGLLRRIAPERHEQLWETHIRLLSESIVYVARQLREFLSEAAFRDADLVYREAALGAGGVMAARMRLDDLRAEGFARVLSHVLLKHAHFPPEDDDAALVRLVAAREEKLTVAQAVRFVTRLVGSDPISEAAPKTFAERWGSLRGDRLAEAAGA